MKCEMYYNMAVTRQWLQWLQRLEQFSVNFVKRCHGHSRAVPDLLCISPCFPFPCVPQCSSVSLSVHLCGCGLPPSLAWLPTLHTCPTSASLSLPCSQCLPSPSTPPFVLLFLQPISPTPLHSLVSLVCISVQFWVQPLSSHLLSLAVFRVSGLLSSINNSTYWACLPSPSAHLVTIVSGKKKKVND